MTKIDDILNRLLNCKFRSAYEIITTVKKIPKEIKNEFKFASIEFDNCGWGGILIDRIANNLALLLGYKYLEDKDEYVKLE